MIFSLKKCIIITVIDLKTVPVIVSSEISDPIRENLEKHDFKPLYSCKVYELDNNISFHPDLQIKRLGGKYLVADNCSDYYMEIFGILDVKTPLINAGLLVISPYPSDCLLNVETFGNNIVIGAKSPRISAYETYKHISVKQGYVGCSVLKLCEKAAITEDVGVARALSEIGVDVLLLERGPVLLPGASYGFIGGAGFVFNKNAYFFGNIEYHPQFDVLAAFLSKHRIKYFSLSSEKLTDYGKAVPLF